MKFGSSMYVAPSPGLRVKVRQGAEDRGPGHPVWPCRPPCCPRMLPGSTGTGLLSWFNICCVLFTVLCPFTPIPAWSQNPWGSGVTPALGFNQRRRSQCGFGVLRGGLTRNQDPGFSCPGVASCKMMPQLPDYRSHRGQHRNPAVDVDGTLSWHGLEKRRQEPTASVQGP